MTSFVPSTGAALMPRARLRGGEKAQLRPLKLPVNHQNTGPGSPADQAEAAVSAASAPLVNEFLALGPALTRAGVGAPPDRPSRRSEPGRISGRILAATARGPRAARSPDASHPERVPAGHL